MSLRIFARSLATATKATKPPVQLFGLDGTYANALYSASVQDSSIDKTFESLTRVRDLLNTDSKVKSIFENPALTKDDRAAVASTVAENLKLDKTVANFLKVLAENNRMRNVGGVYEKFAVLNDAYKGVVEAKITSAKPLDSKILRRLQTAIGKSAFVGESKTLKVSNTVDPEILGGLIVEVGDRTADLSISSKVAKLNQTLSEAL